MLARAACVLEPRRGANSGSKHELQEGGRFARETVVRTGTNRDQLKKLDLYKVTQMNRYEAMSPLLFVYWSARMDLI
jgi:hypothetical protein